MAVTSRNTTPQPPRVDWSMLLGRVGMILSVVAFGGLFWAINGGFSVLGLETFARSFNTSGRIFWAIISAWTFPIPAIPYAPPTQPVVPWIGVIAASLLQVVIVYRKLMGLHVPRWMMGAAVVLSLYDLATTYFGLGTLAWLAGAGPIVQGLLAVVLTFIVELTVSLLLKELAKWKQVSA